MRSAWPVRNLVGGCGTSTAGAEHRRRVQSIGLVPASTADVKALTAGVEALTAGVEALTAGVEASTAGVEASTATAACKARRRMIGERRLESEVELRRKDHQDKRNNSRRTTMQYAVTLQDEECSKAEVFEGGGVTEVPKTMTRKRSE